MIILPCQAKDAARILEIEGASFSDPWSLGMIEGELTSKASLCVKAEEEGNLIGYGFVRLALPEAELLRIAVAENERSKGVGSALLEGLIALAEEQRAEEMFLEVRKTNSKARMLYEKSGFGELGIRKGYYSGGEDAVLYKRLIKEHKV